MALTKVGKILIAVVGIGGIFVGITVLKDKGIILKDTGSKAQVVGEVDLPTAPSNAKETVPLAALPTGGNASVAGPQFRLQIWEWNAQYGLLYAVGGKTTAKGSLAEKYGVNIKLERQDMTDQMQASLIKFATEYSKNPATTEGFQGVVIMGDGAPQFLQGINPQLSKIGPEYRAEIVDIVGYSHGEDAFLGLPEWREDAQKAKGAFIAAVIRDGDWNIAVQWAGANGIKVNPNEKTYDPDALNFVNPTDYLDAAAKYIAGYSEDRPVVKNGIKTGETKHITVNGVCTWTPGDVNIVEKKGGLVKIVSTKEYAAQMPAVVVVIKKWADDNRKVVTAFIQAVSEGANQVKSYSSALDFAGKVSADVYADQDGAYWTKYFKGETKADKQGLNVALGGSSVSNLSDNLNAFGLKDGSANTLKIVYNTFGDIDVKLYPILMPTYPSADSVIDGSFLKDVASATPAAQLASADVQKYSNTYDISQKISEKAWAIEFQSGNANLTPKAAKTLDSIANQSIIASGTRLKLTGYTDNVGNPASNVTLSQARAESVKAWLQAKYSYSFPDSRVSTDGQGDANPIADNSSALGRAKNRRVVVLMGK